MARKTKKKVDQADRRAEKNRAALLGIGTAEPGDAAVPVAVAEEETKDQKAPWRVVGAAVKGISHERTGAPCQDAQDYRILADGTLVIAVADGAGSARFSDQGARTAVDEVLRCLADVETFPTTNDGWDQRLAETFTCARQAVVQLAETSGEWLRDYASTLTVAVVTPEQLVVGQIGDGAVVALDSTAPVDVEPAGAELFTVTRLQRGEYANETHFLIETDALDRLTVERVDKAVEELAVMSDGLIRLALRMPSQEPHTPFFQPLFGFVRSVDTGQQEQAAEQLARFLASERVNARTDDDKSLVLALRVSENGSRTAQVEAASSQEQGSK